MNHVANRKRVFLLVIGDLVTYIFSLILSLAIRYGEIPTRDLLIRHALAFSVLFVVFILVSFSAGLYDKQLAQVRGRIQGLLIKVQIVNAVIGVLFFYFAPVAIAPKANLFIFFVVSTILLFVWRMVIFPVLSVAKRQAAIIVGVGDDIQDLYDEVNSNARYGLSLKRKIEPLESVEKTVSIIAEAVEETGASVIVADLHNNVIESAMPSLYSMIFSGIQIIDASKLYEAIFDRIPIGIVGERWLVENSSTALGNRRVYDSLKRAIDVIVSFVGGVISLFFYPFVYLAIKIEDKGPIFITQDRIGRNGKSFRIIKFRSMSDNDNGRYDVSGKNKNKVTQVGSFLRRSRIDELPQFWNVLRGDLSMVGPRPELPHLASIYEKEISYYNVRHLVKPGLFGWAQIYHKNHPHHAVDIEEARNKLYYDLYYIRNRSVMLDFRIILRTLHILIRREGR
jgi:exopolysaccharide biosynthesis polyprenyl glycosylphosphotransferase